MESDARPVALVTGGSGGLGMIVARTFLDRGYRVMIVGRSQQRVDQARRDLAVASSVEDGVASHVCDLTNVDEVNQMIGQLKICYSRLDVLVNCVGASDRGLVENLLPERLDDLLQQNLFTALLCSQAALPMLQETGGVIVNIGSLASKVVRDTSADTPRPNMR